MEYRLIFETGHTEIKVSINKYPLWKRLIDAKIAKHGGRETRRSTRYIYFEVDADLLNVRGR